MAQLTVKINGYAYTVACEDGQEAHLQRMAQEVEQRIESVKSFGGGSGEGRMLVMAALLMADELHDTAIEMTSLRSQLESMPEGAVNGATPSGAAAPPRDTKRLAKLARRAEEIAARVEQP